jgi:transforming growth factor-beta-induced protein
MLLFSINNTVRLPLVWNSRLLKESNMFNSKLGLLLVVVLLVSVVPVVGAAGHNNTIVDIAVNDGRFTTLVAAVSATGLVDVLSGSEWTVFAPTDYAFAKLGLNAGNIASAISTAELTDILLYHELGAEVNSDKALTLLGDVTMYNGKMAGLKFFDGSIFVNDSARVIIPDVDASNGVIHVIDTVTLGPWPIAQ